MMLVQLISLLLMIADGRGQSHSSSQYTATHRFNEKLENQYNIGLRLKEELEPACKDISPMCYAVDASYCNEPPLKTYCKATCGYCPKGVPQISIRPTPGECKDLDPLCHTYKEYCAGTVWVQHYCKKSCGLCYEEETRESYSGYSGSGGSKSPCECGISNDVASSTMHSSNKNRVVGGHEALKNKYPWMVSVVIGRKGMYAQCGGSIINTRYVLTAGHCTWMGQICKRPYEASDFSVRVGEHNIHSINDDIKGVTERVLVTKVIRHEDYCLDPDNPTLFNNDITLLKLEKDLDLSHKELGIPCLPEKSSASYDGKKVVVAGWGYDLPTQKFGHSMPSKLQEVEFEVSNDCRRYNWRQHLTTNMICAGNVKEMKDACGGDSGGPLMYKEEDGRYTQIGLVSFGPPGGNCTGIGVYTNLANYVEWIKRNTRDAQCPTGIAKPKKIIAVYKTLQATKGSQASQASQAAQAVQAALADLFGQ